MSVHQYDGEGALIIGREDISLDGKLQQLGLEANLAAWMTPQQRSPFSSPYTIPSPNRSGPLTPGFFDAQQERRAPNYVNRKSDSGSLLSPYLRSYPAFGMQTPPWSAFDAAPCGPGAIGQERNSPFSSFDLVHHHSRTFLRSEGRHVREHSSGHHNIVDVDRIRKGADVRTTASCQLMM